MKGRIDKYDKNNPDLPFRTIPLTSQNLSYHNYWWCQQQGSMVIHPSPSLTSVLTLIPTLLPAFRTLIHSFLTLILPLFTNFLLPDLLPKLPGPDNYITSFFAFLPLIPPSTTWVSLTSLTPSLTSLPASLAALWQSAHISILSQLYTSCGHKSHWRSFQVIYFWQAG